MLLRQFRLGNNLLTHIRGNTDFPRKSLCDCRVPRQISKADDTPLLIKINNV